MEYLIIIYHNMEERINIYDIYEVIDYYLP